MPGQEQTLAAGAYCPAAPVSDLATTTSTNDTAGPVAFRIANANTLATSPNWAFNDWAAP